MTDLADWAETAILEEIFNTVQSGLGTITSTTVHLHTGDPGEAGGANEVATTSWTNYSAPTVNNNNVTTPHWSAPATGSVNNTNEIPFGTATISPSTATVTVTHVSVKDNSANVIFKGALTASKDVQNGDPVKFTATSLSMSLD